MSNSKKKIHFQPSEVIEHLTKLNFSFDLEDKGQGQILQSQSMCHLIDRQNCLMIDRLIEFSFYY